MTKVTIKPRKRFQKDCSGPSRTEQAHKSDCDIKRILKSASLTGFVNHSNPTPPQYDSAIGIPDFHTAMNIVAASKSTFAALPSQMRLFFRNDPSNYIDFCSDPSNREEMNEMGLDTSHFPAPEPISEPPASPEAKTTPKAASAPAEPPKE